MTQAISTFLLVGLLCAAARVLFEAWTGQLTPRRPKEPHTASDIADEGRKHIAETDVTYQHYNRQVRH